MASSNVIASRSPPNSDLPRQSSTSSINLHSDQARGFSMNMDEILRNIYADPASFAVDSNGSAVDGGIIKSADEVWRDIVNGGGAVMEPTMTLEDFLTKAGAVTEEEVRVAAAETMPHPPPPPPPPTVGAFGIETVMMNPVAAGVPGAQFSAAMEFGGGGGRGKRRVAVEEPPLDKATQQKQRRMIKNRESAARSRERKQAYTVELEALVTQLEEDHAKLLKQEVESNNERHKQLMENLVPLVEKQRSRRVLPTEKSAPVEEETMEKLIPDEEKQQRPRRVLRRTRSDGWEMPNFGMSE